MCKHSDLPSTQPRENQTQILRLLQWPKQDVSCIQAPPLEQPLRRLLQQCS